MADDFGGDGWDEDLDDLIDDDDDVAFAPAPAPMPAPTPAPAPNVAVPGPEEEPAEDFGWGDDDLDDLDVSAASAADEEPSSPAVGQQTAAAINYSVPTATTTSNSNPMEDPATEKPDDFGWEDDEDLFSDANEIEQDDLTPAQTPQASRQQHHKIGEVYNELVSYVESLMILQPSINAVLQADYNNDPSKAAELLHYYTERPQLRQYTIEKELSRMDYQVVLEHEDHEPIVIDNKEEIAQLFRLQSELDILVRCANQSLLADLLHVMTGPDGLVRPQYMATCLAESCAFTIRCRPGISGGLVECTSRLVLSLPEPSGSRFPVANLQVSIMLGVPTRPDQAPMIQFKLQSMDIVIPSMDVLRPTAQFLLESGLMDHPEMSPFPGSPGINAECDDDTFRDVFLQQSQTVLQNSSVGLKSAWKQIDSVAGLQSKMNLVKNLVKTDNSVWDAAMQEQDEFQQQLQARKQQEQRQVPEAAPALFPRPEIHHQQQQQQQQPPPADGQARPTSILGSFMGRLAKSVAIPDEDPSMYENYAAELKRSASSDGMQQQQQGAFPRPPANAAPPASAPMVHLYRNDHEEPPEQQHSSPTTRTMSTPPPAAQQEKKTSPWLSQMHHPEPAQTTAPAPSQFGATEPTVAQGGVVNTALEDEDVSVGDGWDDDVDLALEEDVLAASQDQKVNDFNNPDSAAPTAGGSKIVTASTRMKAGQKKSISRTAEHRSEFTLEDDIVETRKRWKNPSPGPRYLQPLLS